MPDSSQSPFPDIISLSPNQPFFIAAPTFRQLLRLLANLGHASVEVAEDNSPNAAAVDLSEKFLRPTLQFQHFSGRDRNTYTILWLEIDAPHIISGAPSSATDTSRLPYRSFLGNLGVQHIPNAGSELFVCQMPLPPLPRKLPDISMYLQNLVMTSRRANDSSGLRRLSKIVDKSYPNPDQDAENDACETSKKKVSGLFSRVMNRNGDKRRGGPSTNAESYDLVTPFRLDS